MDFFRIFAKKYTLQTKPIRYEKKFVFTDCYDDWKNGGFMNKIIFFLFIMVSLCGTAKAQIVDSMRLNHEPGTYFHFEHSYPLDTVQYGYPLYLFNEPHDLYLPSQYNPNVESPIFLGRAMGLPYALFQKYDNNDTLGKALYGIATTVLRPDTGFFTIPGSFKFVVDFYVFHFFPYIFLYNLI